ncbi:MAG TPA: bifunctional phosphopantothenoylcysteine decarboxylase/phosphopantothenate--cysteine ligase CoaBC [Bacteriovoracaceae bacterium]|nr:bifunctional phosphopantothenoylcysteine decarboxylase/phosphopantothenate--cysteine ligase CoaBC [Bacteriovoracaceae bacterium]
MKILLAITGSIACYKSYDVARLLVKGGHEVKVILTSGALEFIKPETFRYLGVQDVFLPSDDFRPAKLSQEASVLHIELSKWAEKLVVAPLSANTLSRLALGLSNDLLGSLFLAWAKKPVLFFPAMNTLMWSNQVIQQNVEKLRQQDHVAVVDPVSGLLACGDTGAGKFPEVTAVVDLIETHEPQLKINKTVVVTAGATASPLDPVRYLTNPSTGRMGISVAKAFLRKGYQVTVLAGHECSSEVENLAGHPNFTLHRTPTTELMKQKALEIFPQTDLYISTGAIADIEFETASVKLKKETMGSALPFRQAADILQQILKLKKPGQKIVSFAAETNVTKEVFMEKMTRKPVDLMIGNPVSNGLIAGAVVRGFKHTHGEYYFVEAQNIHGPFSLSKNEVGGRLTEWFEGQKIW